jgi:L-iditol 2-dehydrogenase
VKAAVYRTPGEVRVEEVPRPEAGPGELLVRVEACGICGTDLKKIAKGLLPAPRIFGHEIAGRVVREAAGRPFREGDRVVLHHHLPCRDCFYCRRRAFAQCERYKRNGTTAGFEPAGGGFAEYVKAFPWIAAEGTIPVPEGVSAEEATFVEPVNTCLKAVRKAGIGPGSTVLVVGQGPVGLLLMQVSRWAGADAFASDLVPERRQLARVLGASAVLDAAGDVAREVRALTEGRGADVAVLAALGSRALDQALAATRAGGTVVAFAATSPGETVEVDLGRMAAAEKQLLTSYSADVEVQDLAAQLVFGREVRVAELVSHRFPLARAPEAVALAARPTAGTLKVMLTMDGEAPCATA